MKPEEFVDLSEEATEIGFAAVMSGPLVRSSYRAGKLYAQALKFRGEELPENLSHLAETTEGPTTQEASSLLERYGASADVPVVANS